MDINTVREAIANTLEARLGDVRIYPQMPDNGIPPFVAIYPQPFDYPDSYDDTVDVKFTIVCVAGAVDSTAAQKTLDDWISIGTTASIRDAIRDDESLGGVVSSAVVERCNAYQPVVLQDGGTRLMTAELIVDVLGLSNIPTSYILTEDSGLLLTETGDPLILEG